MGIHHKDGYSAHVEAFFVVNRQRFRLAKTNGSTFSLAEPCELAPHTEGDLLIIVDGRASAQRVEIMDGVSRGQTIVRYQVTAPF